MTSQNVTIKIVKDEISKELDRLLKAPGVELLAELEERTLTAGIATEALIHIETGSLKATARIGIETEYPVFRFSVHVGGASPGMPRDPAFYGVYELARGGDHFYLEPAYRLLSSHAVQSLIKNYLAKKPLTEGIDE